jgi:hypothetical protein
MRLWIVPMTYMGGAVIGGLLLPRIERVYLASYTFGLSVTSVQAFLSAVASGMMALTAIVFASKYPPAEPGALGGEPLKAAIGGATRPQ